LPQLYLWEPDAYKDKVNSFTLYQGIVIGISGLLALVLTILFVVKGSIMFPAAAALAWAVLVYIGVDFGFWGKVLDMSNNAERVWRAGGEAILAATLLVFLFAYLNLSRWHVRYSHITVGWLVFLGSLVALALFDPAVASGIARMSLVLIAVAGFALIVYLSTHGFDRAVLLIPTWFLLVVWVVAAGMTVAGSVTNDIVGPALLGGLVLIVMLIGFTVMQHAFAGGGASTGVVSDVERRALALTGSGDLIWDWDVSADKVFTSPETESLLGLKRGTLEGPAAKWLEVLHPARPWHTAALGAALTAYLLITHIAESGADVGPLLRRQAKLLAVGACLLALGAGFAMIPASAPGAGSAILRVIAAAAVMAWWPTLPGLLVGRGDQALTGSQPRRDRGVFGV